MIKYKKSQLSKVRDLILVLLVLAIMIYIISATGVFEKFKKSLEIKCNGNCKTVCDSNSEYLDEASNCKEGQVCCIPFDGPSSEGGSSNYGPGSGQSGENPEKPEGERCDNNNFKVYDVFGNCVTKCDYCASPSNKKKKTEICKTNKFTSDFSCVCNKEQSDILKNTQKSYEGYCPGNNYCCDESFIDESPPEITTIIKPEPSNGVFLQEYTLEVFCDDKTGVGCITSANYILSNIKISELRCDSDYFKSSEKLTFNKISTPSTPNTLKGEIKITKDLINKYLTQSLEGYKGNIYVYICSSDSLKNIGLYVTKPLPVLTQGTSTNCETNIFSQKCVNNLAPCFYDDKLINDKNFILLKCSGVYHTFYNLNECNIFLKNNLQHCKP